jgi:hypothetical protein
MKYLSGSSSIPHVDAGKTRIYMGLQFYHGANTANAFPYAARNTAYAPPFIVSTVNVTGERFMAIELTRPPSA